MGAGRARAARRPGVASARKHLSTRQRICGFCVISTCPVQVFHSVWRHTVANSLCLQRQWIWHSGCSNLRALQIKLTPEEKPCDPSVPDNFCSNPESNQVTAGNYCSCRLFVSNLRQTNKKQSGCAVRKLWPESGGIYAVMQGDSSNEEHFFSVHQARFNFRDCP